MQVGITQKLCGFISILVRQKNIYIFFFGGGGVEQM